MLRPVSALYHGQCSAVSGLLSADLSEVTNFLADVWQTVPDRRRKATITAISPGSTKAIQEASLRTLHFDQTTLFLVIVPSSSSVLYFFDYDYEDDDEDDEADPTLRIKGSYFLITISPALVFSSSNLPPPFSFPLKAPFLCSPTTVIVTGSSVMTRPPLVRASRSKPKFSGTWMLMPPPEV